MLQIIIQLLHLSSRCLSFIFFDSHVLVGFNKLIVLQVFLFEKVDLLLAFLAQQLVLLDEDADEGVDRFDLFEINDGQVANEDS